jgi:hypothetical protein
MSKVPPNVCAANGSDVHRAIAARGWLDRMELLCVAFGAPDRSDANDRETPVMFQLPRHVVGAPNGAAFGVG